MKTALLLRGGVFALLLLIFVSHANAITWAPGLENWNYRADVNVTNNSGSVQNDVTVMVTVLPAKATFWSNINEGAKDLRAWDSNDSVDGNLMVWIEDWKPDTNDINFWVKIPVLSTGINTIRIYWGNSGAISDSNGEKTFSFFDDFSDGIIAAKWTDLGGSSESGGIFTATGAGAWRGVDSVSSFGATQRIRTQTNFLAGTNDLFLGQWGTDRAGARGNGIGGHPNYELETQNAGQLLTASNTAKGSWIDLEIRTTSGNDTNLIINNSDTVTHTGATIPNAGDPISIRAFTSANTVDVNFIFSSVWFSPFANVSNLSATTNKPSSSVTANFSKTAGIDPLDPENGIITTFGDFNDVSTLSGVTATAWQWKEDDVNISTDQNLHRIFSSSGDFNICMEIFTDGGKDQRCDTFHVSEYPQGVNFVTFPSPQIRDINGDFNGVASDNGVINDWNWSFGDATATQFGQNTSHAYSSSQDYNVCLIVDDNEGLERQKCNTVPVVFLDSNFLWSGTIMLDPENSRTSVPRDFNDDSTKQNFSSFTYLWQFDGNNAEPNQNLGGFDFNSPQDYNACLTVTGTDSNGATYPNIHCSTVHIAQYPQDVNFTWSPLNPTVSQNVVFSGTATDDNAITVWNWGFLTPDENFATQNANHTFSSGGNKLTCLTAGDGDDLNKTKCYTVVIGGILRIQWLDENTNSILTPTLTRNGVSVSLDANKQYVQDLTGISAQTWVFEALDTNHGLRTYRFDVNSTAVIDMNLLLLLDTNGFDIEFELFSPSFTKLGFADVEVYNGVLLAEKNISGGDAKVSFFLNPQDANYSFVINDNAGNQYIYRETTLTVKLPKDEVTLSDISTFSVDIGGLASQSFTGLSADVNAFLFSDTVKYYAITVDDENDSYFARTYAIRFQGGEDTNTLQPYLIDSNGYAVTYIITNTGTNLRESDIVVRNFRNIASVGTVEIESTQSDGAGIATVTFIANSLYTSKFFTKDGNFIFQKDIKPTFATYYVNLSLRNFDNNSNSLTFSRVNFTPVSGIVAEPLTSSDLNFGIDVNTSLQVLSAITGRLRQGSTVYQKVTVADSNTSMHLDLNVNYNVLNKNTPLVLTVDVNYLDGNNSTFFKVYYIDTNSQTLLNTFTNRVPQDFGCEPNTLCVVPFALAIFITLGVAFSLTRVGVVNLGLFAVLIPIVGFFVYITWIPWYVFIFGVAIASAVYIIQRRPLQG